MSKKITEYVLEQIALEAYDEVVVYARRTDPRRIRPPLFAAAANAQGVPHGNLAQALGIVGGSNARRLLHSVVADCLRDSGSMRNEDTSLHILSSADALLHLMPCVHAARLVVRGLKSEHALVRAMAGRVLASALSADPPMTTARVLEAQLSGLLKADETCFVNALPALIKSRRSETEERLSEILQSKDVGVRALTASVLLRLAPEFGLAFAIRAFRSETSLPIRLSLASALSAGLNRAELRSVVRDGLRSQTQWLRLEAARLLYKCPSKMAETVARRTDLDPAVESVLKVFRRPSVHDGTLRAIARRKKSIDG